MDYLPQLERSDIMQVTPQHVYNHFEHEYAQYEHVKNAHYSVWSSVALGFLRFATPNTMLSLIDADVAMQWSTATMWYCNGQIALTKDVDTNERQHNICKNIYARTSTVYYELLHEHYKHAQARYLNYINRHIEDDDLYMWRNYQQDFLAQCSDFVADAENKHLSASATMHYKYSIAQQYSTTIASDLDHIISSSVRFGNDVDNDYINMLPLSSFADAMKKLRIAQLNHLISDATLVAFIAHFDYCKLFSDETAHTDEHITTCGVRVRSLYQRLADLLLTRYTKYPELFQ